MINMININLCHYFFVTKILSVREYVYFIISCLAISYFVRLRNEMSNKLKYPTNSYVMTFWGPKPKIWSKTPPNQIVNLNFKISGGGAWPPRYHQCVAGLGMACQRIQVKSIFFIWPSSMAYVGGPQSISTFMLTLGSCFYFYLGMAPNFRIIKHLIGSLYHLQFDWCYFRI